jgi:AraC family transcriptional regulator, arabinose operon regulatory protein
MSFMDDGKARCIQLGEDILACRTAELSRTIKDPRIEIALLLVAEGHVDLDLDTIASRLNLSVSRFRHLFRAEVGVTFHQFFRSYRLLKARQIFATKRERIKEVMGTVGFCEISRFVKDYKSLFGETPSETKRHSAKSYADELKARMAKK